MSIADSIIKGTYGNNNTVGIKYSSKKTSIADSIINGSYYETLKKRKKEKEEEQKRIAEQQKLEKEQQVKKQIENVSTYGPTTQTNKVQTVTDKLKNIAPVSNEAIKSNSQIGETQKVTRSDVKAQQKATEINRDLKNGNKASAIGAILNGIPEGIKSGVAKSINALNILGARTFDEQDKKINWMQDEILKDKPNATANRLKDMPSFANRAKNKLLDKAEDLDDRTAMHSKTVSQIENSKVKTAAGVSSSIGEMVPAMISNIIAPGSGIYASAVQNAGGSAMETLNSDRNNIDKAVRTGVLKGTASALTEKITGGNLIAKGGLDNAIGRAIKGNVKSKIGQNLLYKGYQILGEMGEEQLENEAGYVIDKVINNKDMPDLKQRWEEATETAKMTGLTTIALNLVGLGGGSIDDVELSDMSTKDKKTIKDILERAKKTGTFKEGELADLVSKTDTDNKIAPIKDLDYLESAKKNNIDTNNETVRSIAPIKDDVNTTKYSMQESENNAWQEYLNKNYKNTGRGEAIKDVKLAPVKNNVAPSMGNNVLSVAENRQKKSMNPAEIANLKLDDASTTPKLETKNYKPGNKQSSFTSNILNDAQFLNKDLRQEMGKDENVRYYSGITNAETLEKAYNSLKEGGEKETLNWFSKNEKNISAEDVTKGWILLKQYQDAGDYQGAVEVAKKMRQMGTSAGQAVQAYNIMARMSPEGMFYYAQSELNEAFNKMIEGKSKQWIEKNQDKFTLTPEETQTIIDTMKEVGEMEDGREKTVKLAEIQKLVSDKIPASAGQSIKAWMRISMLFNPKTQVRNVMGNSVVLPVNATADVFSGAMDKLISKKTGVRTTGVTKEGIKGYAKGFGKGLFESYDDFRKGINTRNVEGNRFEIGEGKSFKDKGLGKALNRVDSLLSFSLDAGDRGFYEASFTNSINNQLVLNNTTKVTQEMIDIATNEALQRTWQDDNAYTQSVLNIRRILNKANVKGYGLGDVLIPFAKTPANLTKAIVDYSPVGLVKTLALDARKFNNSLSNGQYSPQLQHKFVQNLGKGMAGSLLYVLGYGLAKAGIATGESDDDKDVKNFMKNSLGIGSYSIKVGDKSFSYDWAQPVATPLAIMTNYVKYSKDNPDASAINKAIKSLDIGTEQLLQQSFMESLNTVLNGTGTTMENLSKAILDLPARSIPTFSKQIADMVDETQRTTFEYGKPVQSAINSVISKIPFASKSLPASVDTLGHEVKKYGGNNNLWNVMFNPANTNKGQLSKAGKEIYDVYMQTGDTTIFPRTAPYYINSKGEKVNMTSQERNQFQRVTGKYVENSLNSLMKDADYKKLSNDKKAEIINEIVSDSYSKAKYDVLKIDSKEYEKKRNTLKDVKPSSYYNYKFKTEDMKKDNEKINVLVNANYTDKEKTALYENYILSSTNTTYPLLKKSGIDIDEYMKYLQQDFKSEKKDDGTTSGKTVAGSAKRKTYKYVNSMNISYEQKLLLLGTQYKLNNEERTKLYNYVKTLDYSQEEMQKVFEKLQGFTVYKDGRVTW